MSTQFRDYVTGTSFALTLSRQMIEMLCYMDQYGWTIGNITTARALSDRGLCEWIRGENEAQQPDFRRYRLTEAGRLVMPLLRLAGLTIDLPSWDEDTVELPEPMVTIRTKQQPEVDA